MREDNHLLDKILNILEDKKAINVEVMDVADKTTLTDYFVIASGTSNTHIKALAEEVVYQLKQENILPKSQEGVQTASWVLLDYGEVIVHIFSEETRKFYSIEALWKNIGK